MAKPGAFHQICKKRVFPLYARYTSKDSSIPVRPWRHQKYITRTKRITGLYWCESCDTPTYAVDWRIPKPGESKQKTLEEISTYGVKQ